jgi:DNA repair protein RecO (recombination protein O)
MKSLTDTHGWILTRRPQGDTSLVLELLTLEAGRFAVLAKAGRKNPLLQSFQPLWLNAGGRGNLPLLRRVEATGPSLSMKGESLWCAFYINELLIRLLPEGEVAAHLFSCYGSTLEVLASGGDVQRALRHFEQQLLIDCGYGLDLSADVQQVSLSAARCYRLTAAGLAVAAQGYPGAHLLAWQAGQWDKDIARTARDLLREALAVHLGPAPLKSRELLRSLRTGKT